MPHVVTAPPAPWVGQALDQSFTVHVLPVAEDNLAFLIETSSGEVVVVDAPDADAVLAWVEQRGRRLVAVLNTHTHADHIGINRALDRMGKLSDLRVLGCADRGVPGLTDPVDDGDERWVAGLPVAVMRTEGHQNGHLSFRVGDVLFCGDTLFTGGCGYLFDGPPAAMYRSLQRLAALPGDTWVCCAHEYTLDNLKFAWSVEPGNPALATRLARARAERAAGRCLVPSRLALEVATNPFLRTHEPALRARVAAALAEAGRPTAACTDEAWFAATRLLKDLKGYRALPDEHLPGPDPG